FWACLTYFVEKLLLWELRSTYTFFIHSGLAVAVAPLPVGSAVQGQIQCRGFSYASAIARTRSFARAVLYLPCCCAGANAGDRLCHHQRISARSDLSVRQFLVPNLRFGTGDDHDQWVHCRYALWQGIANYRGDDRQGSRGQTEFGGVSRNGYRRQRQDHGDHENGRSRIQLSTINCGYIQPTISQAIFHRDSFWSNS